MKSKRPNTNRPKTGGYVTPPDKTEKTIVTDDSWQWGAKSKGRKPKESKPVKPATRPIPGIEQTPGVCGGAACIKQTRIPVWVLARGVQLGMTEAELLADYPNLRAQDLVNAWAYVKTHRAEIERQILKNESA